MKPANPRIQTVNGGSSSIKFALFDAGDSVRRVLEGGIERIGLPEASFRVKGADRADNFVRPVPAPDHTSAVSILMDWIEQRIGHTALSAVGHRVLQVGAKYYKPQQITAETVAALGGVDTLVFAGGIGENAPPVRARICEGLGFLGIELEEKLNAANECVISSAASRVTVRMIRADEELMIAETVCRVLGLGCKKGN